jgi:hypothetical protein
MSESAIRVRLFSHVGKEMRILSRPGDDVANLIA